MTGRRRLVKVPASSANLGPGFDVLAAALDIHLKLEVTESGEFEVDAGDGGLPSNRQNLCVRAFERLHPADGLRFEIRSEIPKTPTQRPRYAELKAQGLTERTWDAEAR